VDITVVTNLPPRVHIFKPYNGATILGPINVTVCASAFDPDGTVTHVEFFQGATSLGVVPTPPITYVTNWNGIFPVISPYCLTWSNVPPGAYTLTAVATDNGGATATSSPVSFSVVTNIPPRVHIETPWSGATFHSPANIHICAEARDSDGTVTSVQFFAGSNSLGVVTSPILVTNWWGVESLYCLTWSNVSVGAYSLKAVATDNGGASATSYPVNISVVPPPTPTVKITSPHNGSTIYGAPVNIHVCAVERYFTNPVVNVQFFSGTNSLGMTTNTPSSCILWSNVPPGSYSLTAAATDSMGSKVTSAPATFTVVTNAPPAWPDPGISVSPSSPPSVAPTVNTAP
jgi:hypothetical protein